MGRRGLSRVLLDTHAWVWSLIEHERLTTTAMKAIRGAESISISAISLYEIGQKVRHGKWPEMEPHFLNLIDIADEQGTAIVPASPMICMAAADLRWDHRDPFDRFIGATALVEGMRLISADQVFDVFAPLEVWPGRVW